MNSQRIKTIQFVYVVCIIWTMIAGFLLPPYMYNDFLPPMELEPQTALDWVVRVFYWPYFLCRQSISAVQLFTLNTITAAIWGAVMAKLITLTAARRNRVYRTKREQQTITY